MVNPLNAPRPRSQTSNPPSSKLSPIWGSSIASSKPTLPPVQEDDESIPPQQRQLLTTPSWYQAPLASRTPLQFYHSPAVSVSQPQRIGSVSQRGVIPSSGATPDLMTHLRQSLPLPANPRISEIGHSHPSLFAPPPSTVHPPRPAPQDYYVVPRPSSSRPAIAHVQAKKKVESSGGRAAKLPPSGCGVCATAGTSEWRRGPAGVRSLCNGCGLIAARRARDRESRSLPQPNTIALIERELEAIGVERFKPADGRYKLDGGARDRIHEAQRRTRAELATKKPPLSRSLPSSKEDKAAAGNLVHFARRASASSTSSSPLPRSVPLASSIASSVKSRYSSNVTADLPPSSTYMLAPPIPHVTVTQPQPSSLPRYFESSLRQLCHDGPITSTGSLQPHYSSYDIKSSSAPSNYAISSQKFDRMSISSLSTDTPSPSPGMSIDSRPTKAISQVEAYSFAPVISPGRTSSVRTVSN